MNRRVVLRLFLLALFLFAGAYQARYSAGAVVDLMRRAERARSPFTLTRLSSEIASVRPEAAVAGIKEGDHLLSVEGEPYTGLADLAVPLRKARAGDELRVSVREGEEVRIRLAPAGQGGPRIADWAVVSVLDVAMPVLCLLLGFWVTALRIEDPIAWLLLALLLSFSQITREDVAHWEGWARTAGIHYHSILVTTWAIWMMLFGIHFPERFPLDRRLPWIKWSFVALLGAYGALQTIIVVGEHEQFTAVARLDSLVRPFGVPGRILYMVAISMYFMCLGVKMGTTRQRDARRRLVLLNTGTAISLMPTFLLALRGLVFGVDPFQVPEWILIPSLMMMFLFPLTLAYVIVVHRALDVRVVIRQGLQYALARRGVAVLQAMTILAVIGVMFLLLSRPGTRRVEILAVLGTGLSFIVFMGRLAESLRKWIDRRFFREAYDTERIFSDLGEQVRTMVRTGPLLETVASRISESLHVPQVALLVEEDGAYRAACALGYEGLPEVRFEAGAATVEELMRAREPLRVFIDDPRSWVNRVPGPDESERRMLRCLKTQVLVPLAANEKLPGFLSLGAKMSEEPFSRGDLRLLQSVAIQTGLALENSRLTAAIASEVAQRERLNREVEIAREVQERLFPQSLPPVEGLEYGGSCRPALWVGGDYFDFLALPQGRLGIAIADVSGKGIGAALLMASLQASLRGQTIQGGALAEMIANVSRLVYDASPDNRYATFFYARYDPVTRELDYVNAGHCPPIVMRRDGGRLEIIRLKAGGTVVGLFPGSTFKEAAVTLKPGDLVVAYTDGISEALNTDDEEWGEEALIAPAAACDGLGAAETIQRLMHGADSFAAGAPQHDDMTLVVLRVLQEHIRA
ncbi:MAG TPA: SpoIIE family protein phosphatase [Candidatus Polarisedimenticolia bacterium]|jgi:sigma-B regulation protein RsbU (phosphoserine phosphatase)